MKVLIIDPKSKLVYEKAIPLNRVHSEICRLLKTTYVDVSHKFRNGDVLLTSKANVGCNRFIFGGYCEGDRIIVKGKTVQGNGIMINVKNGKFESSDSDLHKIRLKVKVSNL